MATGFLSYLWHNDHVLSALNRLFLAAAVWGTTWTTGKGWIPAEISIPVGGFVVVVSQAFSEWNRGRLSAKAAMEAARVTSYAAFSASNKIPIAGTIGGDSEERRRTDLANVNEADRHNGVGGKENP